MAKQDFQEEIDWWEGILAPASRAEWMNDAIDPERRESQFPPRLLDFIQTLSVEHMPRVLDVGSGPLSPLAWGVDRQLIEAIAVDPLADIYGGILQKYGIDYSVKPVKGAGEEVAKIFGGERFDVVYSRNAIDHSVSPLQCVRQMVTVLKTGGILYLEGFENEGSRNSWQGLHQWNLSIRQGNLYETDHAGNEINISGPLPLQCLFEAGPDANEWIRITFRKTGPYVADTSLFGRLRRLLSS